MRRRFGWPLTVSLLLAAMTAAAQVPNSTATTSPPAGEAPSASATIKPGVEIHARPLHAERPLPRLPPHEFTDCVRQEIGFNDLVMNPTQYLMQLAMCERQLAWEEQVVLDDCLNRSGKTAPPRIIQACTESLAHDILQGQQRFFLLANRAEAYFAYGDPQLALDDYTAAIRIAPRNADLYYDRGVILAAQSNDDAALRDLDTAMDMDAQLVPALRQRARIYDARGNFSGALADYSAAIRLQPKAAALWSDRGYVDLHQHAYRHAVQDEAEAIQLDPKLARAWYLRGVAFGDLGESANAVGDLRAAVGIDPSLARYVMIKGKTVFLGLPPL